MERNQQGQYKEDQNYNPNQPNQGRTEQGQRPGQGRTDQEKQNPKNKETTRDR